MYKRVDIAIAGETPTPHAGRRFWYKTNSIVTDDVTEQLSSIAEEQGSTHESAVEPQYISGSHLRKLQHEWIRGRLADAFESE